ncbi:MAG: class I SAM-dependent methyltransferase, partial [Rhodoferax sp.]|nr:class I SAM-dependent methyltransferase [Rhodoferax sp.]
SVGMFEHVGLQNLPQYFDVVRQLLKPDGHFLNHGITHDKEGWRDTISSRFINRHVFPDGELDTMSNVQQVMERSRFEIIDVVTADSKLRVFSRNERAFSSASVFFQNSF